MSGTPSLADYVEDEFDDLEVRERSQVLRRRKLCSVCKTKTCIGRRRFCFACAVQPKASNSFETGRQVSR